MDTEKLTDIGCKLLAWWEHNQYQTTGDYGEYNVFDDDDDRLFAELSGYYLEKGDEGLYLPFNKDFLNYTVEQGYSESFPFGNIHEQSGFVLYSRYAVFKNLNTSAKISYWLANSFLEQDFNFLFGLHYNINFL